MMRDRIPCVVPFCRRTVARSRWPDATEVICGPHWRLAPKRLRRLYMLARRRWERGRDTSGKAQRRGWRLWDKVKAKAIAAAGAAP